MHLSSGLTPINLVQKLNISYSKTVELKMVVETPITFHMNLIKDHISIRVVETESLSS
jgi:hypothetical protein